MAKKCDLYFTMENKLRRLLKCCFTLYKVPEAKQEEVIGQILKMDLKPIAEKKNVEIVMESFRPVTAEIDETKLSLAISNLVENAVKYNHDNGWVHVSLNADHKFFYVKVRGMSLVKREQDVKERIMSVT